MKKRTYSILLFLFLAVSSVSYGQILQKPNPGYIVTKDGVRQDGFLKIKTTSAEEGIISLLYSKSADGANSEKIKVKDLKEMQLNGVLYVRMKIKTSLIVSSDLMCPVAYRGAIVTLVYNPKDNDPNRIPKTIDQLDLPQGDNVELSTDDYPNTEFHLTKKGQYFKVSRLFYANDMKKIFGDNTEWATKAEDKNWLTFANIKENIRFYEQTATK